jgi:hypothetical protein
MKVTLEIDGKEIVTSANSSIKLFVDNELLFAHEGEETACCSGKCSGGECDAGYVDVGYGQESLFKAHKSLEESLRGLYSPKGTCSSDLNLSKNKPDKIVYKVKEVLNSSFIEQIRWWNWEETLGTYALEVALKDGRYLNYGGVPLCVFNAWVNEINAGGSAGRFFNTYIKYNYELISEIDENGNFIGEENE